MLRCGLFHLSALHGEEVCKEMSSPGFVPVDPVLSQEQERISDSSLQGSAL